ncbi:MAG: hypothetical protein Q8N52_13135 [Acidobacteriota bacterium]|nr:hypothetical protein [Acidobacteriota bacterium]
MLKLAQNGVVVLDQAQADKSGELLLLGRQVSPPTRRSHDLIDEVEVFDEQPLIVHADLDGNPPDYQYASVSTQGR